MVIRADMSSWALLLIAMGIAYFVCLKASKEGSKLFRNAGYAVGIFILAVSLILALGDIGSRLKRRRRPVRRTRPTTTRPATIPGTTRPEIPKAPQLPRRAVGISEPKTAE